MNKYIFDIGIDKRIICITVFANNFENAKRIAIEVMKNKYNEFTISYVKRIRYDKTRREYVETI